MRREEISVGPLLLEEAEAVAALAREIWHAHYPAIISVAQIEYMLAQRYDPEVIRSELARAGIWWDKLLIDGAMRGFASYFLTASALEMKLDKLYVHPGSQRQGAGRRLVERAIATARAQRCSALVLAVNKNNSTAIAAYRKYGFRIREAVVKDIGGGFVMDDYVMVKDV